MLDNSQFRDLIIKPVLKAMSMWTQNAEDLLVGTCAQETLGGKYLIQVIKGQEPLDTLKQRIGAVGPFGMEPRTHDDIWKNYLPSQPKITNDMMMVCCFSRKPTSDMLIYNLYYATAMTRIFYHRLQEVIPATLELQASYYNSHYNTSVGEATENEYIGNYNLFCGIKPTKGGKNVEVSK
jgi:hypothetical protein